MLGSMVLTLALTAQSPMATVSPQEHSAAATWQLALQAGNAVYGWAPVLANALRGAIVVLLPPLIIVGEVGSAPIKVLGVLAAVATVVAVVVALGVAGGVWWAYHKGPPGRRQNCNRCR